MRSTETITNGLPMANLTAGTVAYANNNLNQVTSSTNPNRTYGYDPDGNMTTFFTPDGYQATATYDAENKLATVSYTDPQSVLHTTNFVYGPDGFLVKQVETVGGVNTETRFVRDGYLCLQERNSSNTVTNSYVWDPNAPGGIGGLLELTQGGQHYNYLYDGKGNVSAVIDSTQQPVVTYRYDAFGNVTKNGSFDQPYQFSTKTYYAGLGLNYYGYRFYNPVIGKWMTRDPLGEKGGANIYEMVLNNPINRMDSLGLEPRSTVGGDDPGFDNP